jgi:hypothetical protein
MHLNRGAASICASICANPAVDIMMLGLSATNSRKAFESCACGTSPEEWVVESFIRLTLSESKARETWGCGQVRTSRDAP